jgi:hypothetical protein
LGVLDGYVIFLFGCRLFVAELKGQEDGFGIIFDLGK